MKSSTKSAAVMEKFVKPAVPITIVLLLLFLLNQDDTLRRSSVAVVSILCAIILWFGWSWVRRTVVTKWIGILLAAYLSIILGLFAMGTALKVGQLLLLPFLLFLPFLVYDLFFRQPHKGRFARARAERRNVPPVS